MIGALLDDALVHPSHVILHSSLGFHKGHLLFHEQRVTDQSTTNNKTV